jgi:hypothetical protein
MRKGNQARWLTKTWQRKFGRRLKEWKIEKLKGFD